MKRYEVPRLAFINKLDRMGANPWRVVDQIRTKLKLPAAALQVPIGSESQLLGLVDLIEEKGFLFEGATGATIKECPIPDSLKAIVSEKRKELVAVLANSDEGICEHYLNETLPTAKELKEAIRKATISRQFVPVFMGSAYKNTGVQLLLDGVVDFLPNPSEVENKAIDSVSQDKIIMKSDSTLPFVGLAFKLEEGKYGQLTYVRIYQGKLTRGAFIQNARTGKKVKVPRLVRMHSNEMEDVDEVGPGEICAMFGVECSSGDSFTDGTLQVSMV